jgi:hypothetical protein
LNGIAWINYRNSKYYAVQKFAQEAQHIAQSSGHLLAESKAIYLNAIACSALGYYSHVAQLCNRANDLLRLCGLAEGEAKLRLMVCEAEALFFKTEYTKAHKIQTIVEDITSAVYSPVNYNNATARATIAGHDVFKQT